jgi:hypothetical protein
MLRSNSPDLAIVFISGSLARLPDEIEEEGVRWVRKPFEIGEIVSALTETRAEAGRERAAPHAPASRARKLDPR